MPQVLIIQPEMWRLSGLVQPFSTPTKNNKARLMAMWLSTCLPVALSFSSPKRVSTATGWRTLSGPIILLSGTKILFGQPIALYGINFQVPSHSQESCLEGIFSLDIDGWSLADPNSAWSWCPFCTEEVYGKLKVASSRLGIYDRWTFSFDISLNPSVQKTTWLPSSVNWGSPPDFLQGHAGREFLAQSSSKKTNYPLGWSCWGSAWSCRMRLVSGLWLNQRQ